MTTTTRRKRDRIRTVTPNADRTRTPRGHSADILDHASQKPVAEVHALAMGVALALAEVAACRAAERPDDPATTTTRRSAERSLRRRRAALVRAIGEVPTRALVQALTVDGGMALAAAAAASDGFREHAVAAMVQGASIAIQRGMTDTASLTILASGMQWVALERALVARALASDAPRDVLRLASLANANARHSLLTSDHLARSGGAPIVQPAPAVSDDEAERRMLDHALALERAAGRSWDDDQDPPGEGARLPFSAGAAMGGSASEKPRDPNDSGSD